MKERNFTGKSLFGMISFTYLNLLTKKNIKINTVKLLKEFQNASLREYELVFYKLYLYKKFCFIIDLIFDPYFKSDA